MIQTQPRTQTDYAPRVASPMKLSPEVAAIVRPAMSVNAKFLIALNAKARRVGNPLFSGVGLAEKARRRKAGRVAKATRKSQRVAA